MELIIWRQWIFHFKLSFLRKKMTEMNNFVWKILESIPSPFPNARLVFLLYNTGISLVSIPNASLSIYLLHSLNVYRAGYIKDDLANLAKALSNN